MRWLLHGRTLMLVVVVASVLHVLTALALDAAPPLSEADLVADWKKSGKIKAGEPDDYRKSKRRLKDEVDETAAIAEAMYAKPSAPRLTDEGFSKRQLPEKFLSMLWDNVKQRRRVEMENPDGNLPEWKNGSKTFLITLDEQISHSLEEHFSPVIEEWVGQKMKWSNHYGIRCYTNGSVLSYHVDNVYQLASIIVPVVAHTTKAWPLHIESHKAGNVQIVNIEPGDILLYESYRLPHWRPQRLEGLVCNLFLHWTLPADKWDADAMEAYEASLEASLNPEMPDEEL